MKRLIEYTYNSWTDSCGCCSYSSSTYCMWDDGNLIHEDYYVELCENEEDLRKVFVMQLEKEFCAEVGIEYKEPVEISDDELLAQLFA